MVRQNLWNDTAKENDVLREYICPSATLTTTNPTQIGLGLCSERPKIRHLSYGTTGTLTGHYLVAVKVKERLPVSRQHRILIWRD
jgi:hypothetical protein